MKREMIRAGFVRDPKRRATRYNERKNRYKRNVYQLLTRKFCEKSIPALICSYLGNSIVECVDMTRE